MSAHPCIRVAFLTKESHDLHLLGVGAGKGMGGLWQLEYWGAGRRGHRGGGVAGYSPPPAVSTQRLRVWVRAILPAGCGFRTRRWQGGAENRPWGPGLELLVLPALGPPPPRPGFGASRTILEAEWVRQVGEQRVSPEGLIQSLEGWPGACSGRRGWTCTPLPVSQSRERPALRQEAAARKAPSKASSMQRQRPAAGSGGSQRHPVLTRPQGISFQEL